MRLQCALRSLLHLFSFFLSFFIYINKIEIHLLYIYTVRGLRAIVKREDLENALALDAYRLRIMPPNMEFAAEHIFAEHSKFLSPKLTVFYSDY
jgi:hypothetical protein